MKFGSSLEFQIKDEFIENGKIKKQIDIIYKALCEIQNTSQTEDNAKNIIANINDTISIKGE